MTGMVVTLRIRHVTQFIPVCFWMTDEAVTARIFQVRLVIHCKNVTINACDAGAHQVCANQWHTIE